MSLYSNIKLSGNISDSYTNESPKKILYFSDGTLEMDEIDRDLTVDLNSKCEAVNPQELSWAPWMWYYTKNAGFKALEVCDYLGESLASFFGITTPKYQFELNEYYRLKKEEEEEAKNNIEMGSWTKENTEDIQNVGVVKAP